MDRANSSSQSSDTSRDTTTTTLTTMGQRDDLTHPGGGSGGTTTTTNGSATGTTITGRSPLTTANSNTTSTAAVSTTALASVVGGGGGGGAMSSTTGRPIPRLTHSVSIFVEPAIPDAPFSDQYHSSTNSNSSAIHPDLHQLSNMDQTPSPSGDGGVGGGAQENTLPTPPNAAAYQRRHSAGPVLILQEPEQDFTTHLNHGKLLDQDPVEDLVT